MATRPAGGPWGSGSCACPPVVEECSNSSPAEASVGVRWIRPQRSLPVLQREAAKESLWSLQEPIELPEYRSSADFLGKVEVYKSRYSVVWSCYCRQTNHPVVVKAYEKKKMTSRHKKNAAREIAILKMLHSTEREDRFPGVVGFLGTFEDKYYMYIVQDKCSRGDLFKELIRKGGTMEESRVCTEVVVPLLLTLQYLHSRRIVHRDIKPENIFFTQADELKLGDFGLAINLRKDTPISRVGTLDYMAPEVLAMPSPQQIADEQLDASALTGYNEKVDIWALGVLVYELLAGRPPFEVEDPDQTAMLIMHANLEHFPPQMGPYATSFISEALVKQPNARKSARDLLQHPWVRQHYQVGTNVYPSQFFLPHGHAHPSRSSESCQDSGAVQAPLQTASSSDSSESSTSTSDKLFVPRKRACGSVKMCTEATSSASEARKQFTRSAGVRPVSAISSRTLKATVDEEFIVRPRWQSCPGGSLACTTRLLAEEEAEAAKQSFQGIAAAIETAAPRSDPQPTLSSSSASPPPLDISINVPSETPSSATLSPTTPPPKTPDFELDKELLAAWREHQSRPPSHSSRPASMQPARSGSSFASHIRVSPLPPAGGGGGLGSSGSPYNSGDSRTKPSRFGSTSSFSSPSYASSPSSLCSPSPTTPSPPASRLLNHATGWSDRKPVLPPDHQSSAACKQPSGNPSSLNQNRFLRYIEKQNT